jgi:hypothetical protein
MAEYRADGKVRHVIKSVDLGGLLKWIKSNRSHEWNVEAHFSERRPVRARGITWMRLTSIVRTQDGRYFARGHRVGIALPGCPRLLFHPIWHEIRRGKFDELSDEWIDGISRTQAAHWLKEAGIIPVLVDLDDYFGLVPVELPTGENAPESGSEATPKSATEARDRRITVKENLVTVNGTTYRVSDGEAAFCRALTSAGPGVWVAGREMGELVQPRPDRVFKKLPEEIRALIESKDAKGYRLKPE